MIIELKKFYTIFFISIVLFFFNSHSLYSKNVAGIFDNLGIYFGFGYNQLFMETEYGNVDRKDFAITPSVRICYKHNLILHTKLIYFLGYNEFGGKRKKNVNLNGDEIWLISLELGTYINYNIKFIQFGFGSKLSKILNVKEKYYDLNIKNYRERYWTNYFESYSLNLGVILSFIYSHFNISLETWYGITNLLKNSQTTVRENHFRIMFGYEFK